LIYFLSNFQRGINMPVISSLQAGLKVNSAGNSLNTGEITFGDTNGFFPLYAGANTAASGQLLTGGAYLTLNPAAGPTGIQTLIAGEALTLSIEYNANNQCRFDLTPLGSTSVMLTSPWVAVGTEHSVGVSYDTTSGVTVLSLDGSSVTSILNYATTSSTQLTVKNTIGTNSGTTSPTPNYNGFIDQVATFNSAPSISTLNSMTSDPVSVNSALSGHLESQAVSFASDLKASNGSGSSITLSSSIGGVQIGDTLTDATSNSGAGATLGTVQSIALNANNVVVTLTTALTNTVTSGDTILVNHLPSTTVPNVTLPLSTATINLGSVTGIMAGDLISGFDVPPNTSVISVPTGSSTVVLSQPIGATISTPESLLFTHPTINTNVVTSYGGGAATSSLTVPSTQGIQIGDIAIGAGIPLYDHVVSLSSDSSTLGLAQKTYQITAATTPITFVHSSQAAGTLSSASVPANTSVLTITTSSLVGNIQVGDIVMDAVDSTGAQAGVFTNGTPSAAGTTADTVLGVAVNGASTLVTLSAPTNALTSTGNDTVIFTHTTNQVTTGSVASGSSVLSINSTVGIQTGDIVVDLTSPANTRSSGNLTVTGVGANSVTLSAVVPLTGFSNDTLSFVHPPAVSATPANSIIPPATTGNSTTVQGYQLPTADSKVLYLNNTNGIVNGAPKIGDIVIGPNIPAGDTVFNVDGNAVTLASGTSLPSGPGSTFTFVHQTAPNVQVITLNTTQGTSTGVGYQVGNTITITAPVTANTSTSATYTVANSDIGASTAATAVNIAKAIVNANPLLGSFALQSGPLNGQITLVPLSGTGQVLPLATVTETDQAGINENTIANFYNFAAIKSASSTNIGAANTNPTAPLATSTATLHDSTGTNQPSVATVSYAAQVSTGATPQLHGPIYAELSNLNGTTATYNLFVDGSSVTSGVLNSVGLTINVPAAQGTIGNITPSSSGTITQVNNTGSGSVSYQWASNTGVTNFTQPIGQLTVNLTSNAVNTINATVTNMSVNNVNYKDPVQNVPMLENSALNSQVYTVTGHFYDQFNPNGAYGLNNSGTPWGQYTTQVALSNNDFSYTVAGTATSDLKLNVEQANLSPVSQAAPNANIALDLVATSMPAAWTSAKAMPFTVTIDVPSNATGVTFNPGTGVTLTSSTSTVGHTLTLTGTYSAPSGKGAVGTSTPTLGVLSATLTNEFNNGGQFSMDTVSINGNAAVGQSLYFGMGEANAAGAYSISNLPAGKLAITPFNNASQVNPSTITVTDVLAVMSIAAGKGVPGGLGQAVGATANLLPSDFVAADYNQDGQVTAADALSMLNYIVSVNKSNTPGYTYISATGNALINTPETTTSVVAPGITPVSTNLSPANAVLVTGDSSKVVDIIGVLPGNVVNY